MSHLIPVFVKPLSVGPVEGETLHSDPIPVRDAETFAPEIVVTTPAAGDLVGASIRLYFSNSPRVMDDPDGANWEAVASATSISDNAVVNLSASKPPYRAYRLAVTTSAGILNVVLNPLVKAYA